MSKRIGKPEQTRAIILVESLVKARRQKGLTQKAVATQLGIPQSHLSRIESGTVDLRTSNLVELARLLELELVLVPRSLVPAVAKLVQELRPDPHSKPSRWLYRIGQ